MSAWGPSPLLDREELLDEQRDILRDLARLDDWNLNLAVAGAEYLREEKRAVLKSQLAAVRRRLAEIKNDALSEEGGVNESSSGVHGQQMSPLRIAGNLGLASSSASTSPPAERAP